MGQRQLVAVWIPNCDETYRDMAEGVLWFATQTREHQDARLVWIALDSYTPAIALFRGSESDEQVGAIVRAALAKETQEQRQEEKNR